MCFLSSKNSLVFILCLREGEQSFLSILLKREETQIVAKRNSLIGGFEIHLGKCLNNWQSPVIFFFTYSETHPPINLP